MVPNSLEIAEEIALVADNHEIGFGITILRENGRFIIIPDDHIKKETNMRNGDILYQINSNQNIYFIIWWKLGKVLRSLSGYLSE